MVRLRRDLRGFVLGSAGGSNLIVWFLVLVAVIAGSVAGWLVAGLLAALACWGHGGGLFLEDDRLRARRVLRSKVFSRGRVERAAPGEVVWLRGSRVSGVHLLLLTDQDVELPLSAWLGARRQAEWVESINRWATDYDPPSDLLGERLTLRLSAGQARKADKLLASQDGTGILVAAVECPHASNEYGPVFAEVTVAGTSVRLDRRSALRWMDINPSGLEVAVGGHPDLPRRRFTLPRGMDRVLVMVLVDHSGRLIRSEVAALSGATIPASCRVRR